MLLDIHPPAMQGLGRRIPPGAVCVPKDLRLGLYMGWKRIRLASMGNSRLPWFGFFPIYIEVIHLHIKEEKFSKSIDSRSQPRFTSPSLWMVGALAFS